jgi:hypothetical protein
MKKPPQSVRNCLLAKRKLNYKEENNFFFLLTSNVVCLPNLVILNEDLGLEGRP